MLPSNKFPPAKILIENQNNLKSDNERMRCFCRCFANFVASCPRCNQFLLWRILALDYFNFFFVYQMPDLVASEEELRLTSLLFAPVKLFWRIKPLYDDVRAHVVDEADYPM